MSFRVSWGTGIALTYAVFALATSGFVAFAMGRRVDLVSTDYYERSLELERRLNAKRNAAGAWRRGSARAEAEYACHHVRDG